MTASTWGLLSHYDYDYAGGGRVLHLANVEELEHDAKGGGVSVSDSMGGGALLHQPGQIADFTCT